jgi:hypothetical protein
MRHGSSRRWSHSISADPNTRYETIQRVMAARVGPGGAGLIGVDLKKDRETVLAAYDDRDGVTARFNRNLLARINRELGGDFGIDTFEHQALERGGLDLQQFADLATATGWCLGPVWTDSKDRSAVVALIANG